MYTFLKFNLLFQSTSNFHEFTQCRFNATHYAKRGEIENHEESCPNRLMIDKSAFGITPFSPENQLARAPYMT